MLKIVIYDSGVGGELFANYLKRELPIVEIVRVVDHAHSSEIIASHHKARLYAEEALSRYIGKVDLVVLANHLLSLTSLSYFTRKYPNQTFLGLGLPICSSKKHKDTLILTTSAMARTLRYHLYLHGLKGRTMTITLDDMPDCIDNAKLSLAQVKEAVLEPTLQKHFKPREIILACAHFSALEAPLRRAFGTNVRIRSGYTDALRGVCRALNIRGGCCFKQK